MSEKYSTDESVNWLYKQARRSNKMVNIIIARLRAGDVLCEAAKLLEKVDSDSSEFWTILHKAIADYEGKEKK